MNFWFAQFIFIGSTVTQVFSMYQQKRERILFYLLTSVSLGAIGYTFLGAYEGTESLIMMALFACISYICSRKEKKIPLPLIVGFLFLASISDLLEVRNVFDLAPIVASSCFMIGTTQQKEKNIRIFTLVSLSLFFIFDIDHMAIVSACNDCFGVVATVVAIARFELMPKLANK